MVGDSILGLNRKIMKSGVSQMVVKRQKSLLFVL